MGTLNINVGLLGHVDSGKTSLAKAMSQVASTASFDKHPQAQERGITIDLGFSSFKTEAPPHLKEYKILQFTLVDCPGHASLISTVIGGAQIIDLMILVVDATKGVQTQTAECLVLAEITRKQMIVVLNKVDLLKSKEHEEKVQKKMRATVDGLSFKGCPIVCASATEGSVEGVINCLKEKAFVAERNASAPFLFAVDHCFGIQGKGTVLTGTVLQGTIGVGDDVEIPAIKACKKVKSIQVFRQSVNQASQGDRVGICVTQFDPKTLERGLVGQPKLLAPVYAAIFDFTRVRYYGSTISSRARFHVAIGHETVIATVMLFEDLSGEESGEFDKIREYKFVQSCEKDDEPRRLFALLEFEKPVVIADSAWAIGARLDLDRNTTSCRMAFYGRMQASYTSKTYRNDELAVLKIYKEKSREGTVERAADTQYVIGKNMFKKTTDMSKFLGLKVELSTGEKGVIESSFGQSGKFKVRLQDGLKNTTQEQLNATGKGKAGEEKSSVAIVLTHKRYIFDPNKRILQTS